MRVACQHGIALVSFVLRLEQIAVYAAAAFDSGRRLIHAVIFGNAFREGFVHSDDDGADLRIRVRGPQCFLKPLQLRGIELIGSGIIEIDEVHSALYPVVVGGQLVGERIVTKTLLAKLGCVQPVGKLNDVLLAGLWRDCFMVADAQKNGELSERSDLTSNEVVPSDFLIIDDIERLRKVLGLVLDVLIEFVNRAKIAEVPIEGRSRFDYVGSNPRHYDIAAIA